MIAQIFKDVRRDSIKPGLLDNTLLETQFSSF